MISSYVGYRWQLFAYEIKHWLAQLSSMMLFLVAMLGMAIPVLFYLSLVGFGMLAEKKMVINDAMLFVSSMLLFQTVILDVSKGAIKGNRFTEFNLSLTTKSWLTRGCDCWLAMLCNPMVLLNLLLLGSAGVTHWADLQHMLLFLLLQIVLTTMIFSSVFRTYAVIACCFLLSYLPLLPVLEISLLVVLILAAVLTFVPPVKLNIVLNSYSAWAFWLDFWKTNIRVPRLVLAVSILTLFIAHGIELQRPDLSNIVFLIAGQFLVLVVSGLQVELNKLQAEHSAFYIFYQNVASFSRVRDVMLVGAALLIFVLLCFVSSKPTYGTLQFLMLLFCFWVARHRSAYLVYSWLLSCTFMALFQHFVMAP